MAPRASRCCTRWLTLLACLLWLAGAAAAPGLCPTGVDALPASASAEPPGDEPCHPATATATGDAASWQHHCPCPSALAGHMAAPAPAVHHIGRPAVMDAFAPLSRPALTSEPPLRPPR